MRFVFYRVVGHGRVLCQRIHQHSYISCDVFSCVALHGKIEENHSFRLWVVVIHTDVRTTKNVEHLQMVNEKSIKFVFDRGIFWVHGISVWSHVSGVIQQRLCIFCLDGIIDNSLHCAAPVSGGMECARKIRFSARIFAIFFMSWSRPRHFSFVLLFQSLCSLRCTPVRDHWIRIRRPCMYTCVDSWIQSHSAAADTDAAHEKTLVHQWLPE